MPLIAQRIIMKRKNILSFIFLLASLVSLSAQVPYAFNYQGVARAASGSPLSSQDISLLIHIVSGSEDGFYDFTEEHKVTTTSGGLFSIKIGEGDFVDGNLRNIEWGKDVYYLRTEIDITGGDDYVELGTTQLYSVPYALFALEAATATTGSGSSQDNQQLSLTGTSLSIENGNTIDLQVIQDGVNDADADPSNEIQSLSLTGNMLQLSGANAVTLPNGNGGSDNQTLSLNGKTLSIRDGNSIDLSQVSNDADSDPANEIQLLNISGDQLSLSNGNSVTLPASTGGGSSPWQETAPQTIHYPGEEVSIGTDATAPSSWWYTDDNNTGVLTLNNKAVSSRLAGVVSHGSYGHYSIDQDGNLTTWLGTYSDNGEGFLKLYRDGKLTVDIESLSSGAGFIGSIGSNGEDNIRITTLNDHPNNGFLSICNDNGDTRAAAYVHDSGSGLIFTDGPNGLLNTRLSFLNSNPNYGYMSVHDAQGNEEAGIYVNSSGRGIVFADVKNFRTPHPELEDHDIVYASLEGPEAGAYIRGTGRMIKGHGQVAFPDHFKHIIARTGMTVMITPLSASSKGVAVTSKSGDGFTVQELLNGSGTYDFDWEVKAVRAGYEDYQVIRPRKQSQSRSKDVSLSEEKSRIRSLPDMLPKKH